MAAVTCLNLGHLDFGALLSCLILLEYNRLLSIACFDFEFGRLTSEIRVVARGVRSGKLLLNPCLSASVPHRNGLIGCFFPLEISAFGNLERPIQVERVTSSWEVR